MNENARRLDRLIRPWIASASSSVSNTVHRTYEAVCAIDPAVQSCCGFPVASSWPGRPWDGGITGSNSYLCCPCVLCCLAAVLEEGGVVVVELDRAEEDRHCSLLQLGLRLRVAVVGSRGYVS